MWICISKNLWNWNNVNISNKCIKVVQCKYNTDKPSGMCMKPQSWSSTHQTFFQFTCNDINSLWYCNQFLQSFVKKAAWFQIACIHCIPRRYSRIHSNAKYNIITHSLQVMNKQREQSYCSNLSLPSHLHRHTH